MLDHVNLFLVSLLFSLWTDSHFPYLWSDFLSTASNSLGVLFAVSSTTGQALEAISWEEMKDPSNGEIEGRKVAAPEE